MLTKIELQNFKCFQAKTVFPLGQLTLLTGINGRGKSSLLQSLLLMRQSIEHDSRTNKLILNGNCLNLGKFDEIRNKGTSKNKPIYYNYFYDHTIELNQGETITIQGSVNYSFVEDMKDDLVAELKEIEIKGNLCSSSISNSSSYDKVFKVDQYLQDNQTISQFIPDKILEEELHDYNQEIFHKSLNFSAIHYISADRIGPQDFYLRATLPKFPNVGLKGELTVNLLHTMKDELINDKLYLGEDAQTLIIQTQEWLNKVFDNTGKNHIGESDLEGKIDRTKSDKKKSI